jgi:hypothetical protein
MSALKLSDWIALAVFGGFGIWWVIAPSSVIRFYEWFHRGALPGAKPKQVRLAGLFWLVVLCVVVVVGKKKP